MATALEEALEYLDRGWVVIPIRPDSKRPAIRWQEYQNRLPTEDEVYKWWTDWPDYQIAIVTGALSGVVVVDCDNEDALHAAFDAGMRSPVRVKTKRGTHLYFSHPRDGVRRGPRAGINSRGADWPRIDGLDFRGDGSYALLPPSNGYLWDFLPGHDFDDMPVWQDWRPSLDALPLTRGGEFEFSELNLTAIKPLHEFASEWDRTARFVSEKFPTTKKIPTGQSNGRNERVMRYISECIMDGYWADDLRVRAHAFMREFFVDPLQPSEFEATVKSMEAAERRNHPERFDAAGNYLPRPGHVSSVTVPEKAIEPTPTRRLIQMSDAEELLAKSEGTQWLIEPWLKRGTIVQVYGYSGHGKSLFVQHACAALASGQKYYGPFEVWRAGRVLYLDFEMGQATIARRLMEMRQMHGETGDRLQIWSPFLEQASIDFNSPNGMPLLQSLVTMTNPDVVVIDTVRSAWPGLAENSAEDWGKVNKLAITLRNAGIGVVLVHHSNKPGEDNLGREAGSTNQLTTLETQIRIVQVYKDKDTAHQNAALFDGDYDRPVWPLLQEKLPADARLYMVMEVRYGKVREWTEMHDRTQWIGFGQSNSSDDRYIVSSRSTKQRAKDMALEGMEPADIAENLLRPVRVIRQWLEL